MLIDHATLERRMTSAIASDRRTPREELLAGLLDFFGDDGPSPEISMRQLAAALGTSHAMLNYHFGSWSQLTAAVLAAQRRQDNIALASRCDHLDFGELLDVVWKQYSDAQAAGRFRAFFHVSSLAMYNIEAYSEFTESLADLQHIFATALVRGDVTDEAAELYATLAVAGLRGLILQLLLGGEPGETHRAATELMRLLCAGAGLAKP